MPADRLAKQAAYVPDTFHDGGVREAYEKAQADWVRRAREVAVRIAKLPQHADGVSIDEVRDHLPFLPDGQDPRIYGTIFQTGKKGPFENVGYKRSRRSESNGRSVGIFRLR